MKYAEISGGIVRGLFLAAIFVQLPGCARQAPVYGLKPLYPEARMTLSNSDLDFVPVDSLQPTLRWESFPRPGDRQGGKVSLEAQLEPVTYDLRIWRAAITDRPAELVYERMGLPDPGHRIEGPLEPAMRYLWTVRARFTTDDGYRVTEWSKPQFGNLRRSNVVPNIACYRFETPAK